MRHMYVIKHKHKACQQCALCVTAIDNDIFMLRQSLRHQFILFWITANIMQKHLGHKMFWIISQASFSNSSVCLIYANSKVLPGRKPFSRPGIQGDAYVGINVFLWKGIKKLFEIDTWFPVFSLNSFWTCYDAEANCEQYYVQYILNSRSSCITRSSENEQCMSLLAPVKRCQP